MLAAEDIKHAFNLLFSFCRVYSCVVTPSALTIIAVQGTIIYIKTIMRIPSAWVGGLILAFAVSARVNPNHRKNAIAGHPNGSSGSNPRSGNASRKATATASQSYYNSTEPFGAPSYLPTSSDIAESPFSSVAGASQAQQSSASKKVRPGQSSRTARSSLYSETGSTGVHQTNVVSSPITAGSGTVTSPISHFSSTEFAPSSTGSPDSSVLYTSNSGAFSTTSPSGSSNPSSSYSSKISSSFYTSNITYSESVSASSGSSYAASSTAVPTTASSVSSSAAIITTALQSSDSSSLSSPAASTTTVPATSTCDGIPSKETFNIQFSDGGLSELDGQFAVLIQGGFDFNGAIITYTTSQVDASIFTLSATGQLVGVGFPSSNSVIANVENKALSLGSDVNTALLFNTKFEFVEREATDITEHSVCTVVDTVLTCVTGPNRVFYVDLNQPGTTPALRVGPTVPAGMGFIGESLRRLPVAGVYPVICMYG